MSSANQYAKHILLIFTYRSTFLRVPAEAVVALSNVADHGYIQVSSEVRLVPEVVATDNCEAVPRADFYVQVYIDLRVPTKVAVVPPNVADLRTIQVHYEVWVVAEVAVTDNYEALSKANMFLRKHFVITRPTTAPQQVRMEQPE
jgi:hypothetical protein